MGMSAIDKPELDVWHYWNNASEPNVCNMTARAGRGCTGRSMICQTFVWGTYKAAGVLGSLADQINTVEIDPMSAYLHAIFDLDWIGPKSCTAQGACQILGPYDTPLVN